MSTPNSSLVTMISPDGKTGDIPQERMNDAISSGFKIGVPMLSPDGKQGYIPHDRVQEAQKSGFKFQSASGIDTISQAQKAIQNIPQFTSPAAGKEATSPLNAYMRQSGQIPAQTALGMATGGLFPAIKGAGLVKNILPFLGRMGTSAASMGAGTLAGGGTPEEAKTAAITGAAGQPVAEGLNAFLTKIAPGMAESALNVSERMRGRGRTIGQTTLEQTRGVRPGTIATQAQSALGDLTGQMENAVHQATQAGAMGSTQPAHDVLNNALSNLPRNARSIQEKMAGLRDMLDLNPVPVGQARRMIHTPDELLEIKRGIGQEISTWPPEWQKLPAVKQTQQRLYGAIDGELDRLVPGNADLNQKISSLIPAKTQGMRLSDQAGVGQRIAHRVAAHTGALAGSGIGGYLGYKEGGPKGAAMGAAAGLALPEMLASPTAQMTAARMAQGAGQQAVSPGLLPWMKAIAASRQPNKKQDEAENQ